MKTGGRPAQQDGPCLTTALTTSSGRLTWIERAYYNCVLKVSYTTHTGLEVLGMIQKYQDKRARLIERYYEHINRNS
jgi:hypothetical protein